MERTFIELVIKIDEEQYNTIKSDLYNTFPAEMKEWGLEAIRHGTPLPKGHGRLIECERLQEVFRRNVLGCASFKRLFDNAPTIIEADKESEE